MSLLACKGLHKINKRVGGQSIDQVVSVKQNHGRDNRESIALFRDVYLTLLNTPLYKIVLQVI